MERILNFSKYFSNKKFIGLLLLFASVTFLRAEIKVDNIIFAQRDTQTLSLDFYQPTTISKPAPCIMFVFGGGFVMGSKSEETNVQFCNSLAERGYLVAAIDYRLGLKGVKKLNVFNTQPLESAIQMAVEDLCTATAYLKQHAEELSIDTTKIMACGSSAGAVTVLQADYEMANRAAYIQTILPNFRFAGIISLAGAVFSRNGKVKYADSAAPTCFFHGTDDKLVIYNQITFFNLGFFGSNAIVKQFEKFNYPYLIMRYRDAKHEIAAVPQTRNLADIDMFIREYVFKHRQLKTDILVKDSDIDSSEWSWAALTPKTVYK